MNQNSKSEYRFKMEQETISRREREKIRQRQEILQAALELFSQKGFENVTMQEVAQRSEYAVGTLYNLFENKKELYRELLYDHCLRFHEKVMAALEKGADEVESLRNFIRAKFEIFRDNLSLIRLYMNVTQGVRIHPKAGMEEELRSLYRSFLKRLEQIFEKGIKKGIFRQYFRPRDLAVVLDALSTALLFEWVEDPKNNPSPDDENYILDFLFQPLLKEGGNNA